MMSSGHCSERLCGEERPARAGSTRQNEAVTVVKRAWHGQASGAGGVRRNRAAREAERRWWEQGSAVGISTAAGPRCRKELSRKSGAIRADTVNVGDRRACAWRRLSQKGKGGRWALGRGAGAGQARRWVRGGAARDKAVVPERARVAVRHSEW
jgi:hypothetical protein